MNCGRSQGTVLTKLIDEMWITKRYPHYHPRLLPTLRPQCIIQITTNLINFLVFLRLGVF